MPSGAAKATRASKAAIPRRNSSEPSSARRASTSHARLSDHRQPRRRQSACRLAEVARDRHQVDDVHAAVAVHVRAAGLHNRLAECRRDRYQIADVDDAAPVASQGISTVTTNVADPLAPSADTVTIAAPPCPKVSTRSVPASATRATPGCVVFALVRDRGPRCHAAFRAPDPCISSQARNTSSNPS